MGSSKLPDLSLSLTFVQYCTVYIVDCILTTLYKFQQLINSAFAINQKRLFGNQTG